ncbi:MAG: AAA family ATPase [Bacteroidales bacterium]|nr:AAA family ATPase [Bacteroidales bacterium]
MDSVRFAKILLEKFPYEPTPSQGILIHKLVEFIVSSSENEIFILEGYAGTGKTTVVSTLVKHLSFLGKRSLLLAPTGRAAKVFSSYAGKNAYTIHKKLYLLFTAYDGTIRLNLSKNNYKNTIFMVDEASMIPGQFAANEGSLFQERSLLDDLIDFVKSGENCKLILIGDSAQLPPVGLENSPALDLNFLTKNYYLITRSFKLTEVVRQSLESGILLNATQIRAVQNSNDTLKLVTQGFNDVVRITGIELEDYLNSAFSAGGIEDSVIITRSNKRANIFNQEIRKRILFRENEIDAGDLMMVVKNNYFWLDQEQEPGFIANGDIIEILKIEKYDELYGFRFANVHIRFIDYPGQEDLVVKILLDTILLDGPSLSMKTQRDFFAEVMKDYDDLSSRKKRIESVKNNPFYNALQVKFGYSLTCHKTQGGQWKNVFIDQGYLLEEQINKEYYRWLYTAFTRATEKVYMVNFSDRFFE